MTAINFVSGDANGTVSYHASVLTKVSDLLKSKPSDMGARGALAAWANDLRTKGEKGGTLAEDEKLTLIAVANAAVNGEFGRAQAILDSRPALMRHLSEQVAVIKSWTNTENNQLKEHKEGGWIVLPEGYTAPPLDAPAVFLPQGAEVIRAGDLQDSEADASGQHAHLPLHPGPKPASIDTWVAFAHPADCAGRKPTAAGNIDEFTAGLQAVTPQLLDFLKALPQSVPPSSEDGKAAGPRAHASPPPPNPSAAAGPETVSCQTNCHKENKAALDLRSFPTFSPVELEEMEQLPRPDPNTAEGRVALGMPDPYQARLRPGDLTSDARLILGRPDRNYGVILEPRHIADPVLAAHVEELYGSIVEIESAAQLCDRATQELGPNSGWAWAKQLAVGAPPPAVSARVENELNKVREFLKNGEIDKAEAALKTALQTLNGSQAAWAGYGQKLQSFLQQAGTYVEYANYALMLAALAAAIPTGGASMAATLGLEGEAAVAFAALARTASVAGKAANIGMMALEGVGDIALPAAMGQPIDWRHVTADVATWILCRGPSVGKTASQLGVGRMSKIGNYLAQRVLTNSRLSTTQRMIALNLIQSGLMRETHTAIEETLKELDKPVTASELVSRVGPKVLEKMLEHLVNPAAVATDAVFGGVHGHVAGRAARGADNGAAPQVIHAVDLRDVAFAWAPAGNDNHIPPSEPGAVALKKTGTDDTVPGQRVQLRSVPNHGEAPERSVASTRRGGHDDENAPKAGKPASGAPPTQSRPSVRTPPAQLKPAAGSGTVQPAADAPQTLADIAAKAAGRLALAEAQHSKAQNSVDFRHAQVESLQDAARMLHVEAEKVVASGASEGQITRAEQRANDAEERLKGAVKLFEDARNELSEAQYELQRAQAADANAREAAPGVSSANPVLRKILETRGEAINLVGRVESACRQLGRTAFAEANAMAQVESLSSAGKDLLEELGPDHQRVKDVTARLSKAKQLLADAVKQREEAGAELDAAQQAIAQYRLQHIPSEGLPVLSRLAASAEAKAAARPDDAEAKAAAADIRRLEADALKATQQIVELFTKAEAAAVDARRQSTAILSYAVSSP
jgi:hypothetical protein